MTYVGTPGKRSPALTNFFGLGIKLFFQDGPIREHGTNGTTNEEVIQVLIDRIASLNEMEDGKYACRENEWAILHLKVALQCLELRTAKRLERGVEGTSEV
jgi:hypothetical protein